MKSSLKKNNNTRKTSIDDTTNNKSLGDFEELKPEVERTKKLREKGEEK